MPDLVPPAITRGELRAHHQPTLPVDELLVRPWKPADAPAVAAAYADPAIQRWHVRSMTDEESVAWVKSWPARWSDETGAGGAVLDSEALVGRVSFRAFELFEGLAEAAYWVVPGARGRRIAARCLAAVTEWMFDEAGFHRLVLYHSTQNPASSAVAGRAGYLYEGTARQQVLHQDGWHDMHVHARIREDTNVTP